MTKPPRLPSIVLMAFLALAGCASTPRQAGSNFETVIKGPTGGPIEITSARALVERYGLVVTGAISLAPYLPAQEVHSVDVTIKEPDKTELRTFTTGYFPAPKANKRKPQHARFTLMSYEVPPAGSVVEVSLTPQPKPEDPGQPAPENQ